MHISNIMQLLDFQHTSMSIANNICSKVVKYRNVTFCIVLLSSVMQQAPTAEVLVMLEVASQVKDGMCINSTVI